MVLKLLEIVINQFLNSRDVFMEKHWKSVISRSICDYFFDAQNKATSPSEVSKTNIAFESLPSANFIASHLLFSIIYFLDLRCRQ